jgi:hypothetical protein
MDWPGRRAARVASQRLMDGLPPFLGLAFETDSVSRCSTKGLLS